MLLPLLPNHLVDKRLVVSNSGVSASYAARKFGFAATGSDYEAVLSDNAVEAVFITTPHNLHADMAVRGLQAGKHVFVEKPLALTAKDLEEVADASRNHPDQCLMVGFNRRFSPHIQALRSWSAGRPIQQSGHYHRQRRRDTGHTLDAGPGGGWRENRR
jgi:predicted dehydrogenase